MVKAIAQGVNGDARQIQEAIDVAVAEKTRDRMFTDKQQVAPITY